MRARSGIVERPGRPRHSGYGVPRDDGGALDRPARGGCHRAARRATTRAVGPARRDLPALAGGRHPPARRRRAPSGAAHGRQLLVLHGPRLPGGARVPRRDHHLGRPVLPLPGRERLRLRRGGRPPVRLAAARVGLPPGLPADGAGPDVDDGRAVRRRRDRAQRGARRHRDGPALRPRAPPRRPLPRRGGRRDDQLLRQRPAVPDRLLREPRAPPAGARAARHRLGPVAARHGVDPAAQPGAHRHATAGRRRGRRALAAAPAGRGLEPTRPARRWARGADVARRGRPVDRAGLTAAPVRWRVPGCRRRPHLRPGGRHGEVDRGGLGLLGPGRRGLHDPPRARRRAHAADPHRQGARTRSCRPGCGPTRSSSSR